MKEVRYSINGQYFKSFGVFVEKSDGLIDPLKRKKVKTYDWAEYHGVSADLEQPKYEAREITLHCFIHSDNWETLFANFSKMVMNEFQKSGTQRLLIEPFGYKPLPYEVYLEDGVKLEKTFRQGEMVAKFSLKLIEPNPVKKVLYFTGTHLDLSYECDTETEIFYGNGLKEVANNNVSLSGKQLNNRVVSDYSFAGRNLVADSNDFKKFSPYARAIRTIEENVSVPEWEIQDATRLVFKGGTSVLKTTPTITAQRSATVTYSFWVKNNGPEVFRLQFNGLTITKQSRPMIFQPQEQAYFSVTGFLRDNYDWFQHQFVKDNNIEGTIDVTMSKAKLEYGDSATDWTPAPEDEKFIIIAGNVEDIKNLKTNAEILWEKL